MSDLASTVQLVENVLRKLGLDPHKAQVKDEPATKAWGVFRGSAQVLLAVSQGERGVWVRAIAPVVLAPTTSEAKLTVYARLLDLNAKVMRNAAFGVLGDKIVIVSERPGEGLDEAEVEQIFKHVGATADHYDDMFEKEYGLAKASK